MKILFQKLGVVLISIFLLSACLKQASSMNSVTINNKYLKLSYSKESNDLNITHRSCKKVFVQSLIPYGEIQSVTTEEVTNEIFESGTSLYVKLDKGSMRFTLYENEPFVFISSTLNNREDSTLLIDKLVPVSFTVDLGKPVSTLKTLGTGGLLDVDKNPGSYVFLTTVDPSTRNGVVSGWLSNNKGSGVFFSDKKNKKVHIKAQVDYGQYRIKAGESDDLETLVIGYFDDARLGEEEYASVMAKFHQIELREPTAAYCTWYDEKNGGAGTEASTIELAKYVEKNMKPYGLGVIQIDDQWQDGGSYNGPARGFNRTRKVPVNSATINGTADKGFPAAYPNGLEKTTAAIKDAGLVAGIWWMPFARNHQDPEYADRQDWFAYRKNGKPFETVWGGTSLDLTNPEVLNHVADFSKILQGWGFEYFKMDGLWTGTITEQVYINDGYLNDSIGNCKPLHNPYITQIEAYRNGLKTIRTATNNEVFLSGCNVSQNMRSFGPSIGLVDAMRIGPDFNHDGESFRTGAIRASRLYFLNGKVWWNDPDPSMIREKGVSNVDGAAKGIGSLDRARVLPSFVALSGQFFLSSDWIPDLPEERKDIMRRCMATHKGTARPVDAFEESLPSVWLASDNKTGIDRNVIGLFNWYEKSDKIGCTLDWAGLRSDMTYHAFDFWANKPLADITESIQYKLPKESCQVIALREKVGHPVIVSTSQHITQGFIDLTNEKWNGTILSGTSNLIAGDNYELRIAGLNGESSWELTNSMLVSSTNQGATIKVLPSNEKGWLRVLIESPKGGEINWQLNFKKK